VVLAFGKLLAGDPEAALAELLRVDVTHSPFALAARATAQAMLGDAEAALADVAAVEAIATRTDSNVSYWDLWVARIAGVATATGAESEWRLAELRSGLDQLADVVVRAYANDVIARLTGEPAGSSPAPRGWAAVAAAITRLGHHAQVRLQRLPARWKPRFGIFIGNRGHDDHVFALFPVHRGRHAVPGGQLKRVDHPQNLVEVAAGARRVGDRELDLAVRTDHEHRAHRRGVIGVGMNHVIEVRHLAIRIGDNRIVGGVALRLGDVLAPPFMRSAVIDADGENLDVALVELGLDPRHVAQLGGADRREVLGVREQHDPAVPGPLVEPDCPFGRLRGEIRRRIAQSESHAPIVPRRSRIPTIVIGHPITR
jgi:hypothetical protein